MADIPEFVRLPLLAQTAYARLVDLLLSEEIDLPPTGVTMVSKTIRGRRYWYAQRRDGDAKVQSYVGPETPELMAMVERVRRRRAEAATRAELVAMARAGGAQVVSAAEAEVLSRLGPVFRVGAVLVGSHAFAVLGNMLGVRWQDSAVRTEDVDIAHDEVFSVAIAREAPPLDVPRILGDALPRFSALHPTDPATSFRVRGANIEVDLLTPLVGKERRRTVRIAGLGAAATPLRFLDYLIEETQPAAVLGGSSVLVNVPRPGRFALHKLILVSRRSRGGGGLAKTSKDLAQASALLRVLASDLPGEISLAWKALSRRGRAWTSAVTTSMSRLDPALVAPLRAAGLKPR